MPTTLHRDHLEDCFMADLPPRFVLDWACAATWQAAAACERRSPRSPLRPHRLGPDRDRAFVNLSGESGLISIVADPIWPSASTDVDLINQAPSSAVQMPSAKPPSESKLQERGLWVRGFQPTRWLVCSTVSPANFHREIGQQKVLIFRPTHRHQDQGLGAFIHPLSDHPSQRLK